MYGKQPCQISYRGLFGVTIKREFTTYDNAVYWVSSIGRKDLIPQIEVKSNDQKTL